MPHVLAGPMLRKVTPTSVTVWVALRTGAKATLFVLDADFEMTGNAHTVALGTSLHIVAITAKAPEGKQLVEGKIYRYDMTFDYDRSNLSHRLSAATSDAKLAYTGFDKPSFCLPPKDITDLRIMHGSCRIPHGNGTDTLPMLDALIEKDAKNPKNRPHQLMLTGDQIYADDVGYAMSMMLMDASKALLDWPEEVVCGVPAPSSRRDVYEMYPRLRGHVTQIDAGFTSVDFHGQLIGLGEYLAMYLFVWSDVLWPALFALPSAGEIESFFSSREKAADKTVLDRQTIADVRNGDIFRIMGVAFDHKDVDAESERTAQFGKTIKENVRRALANIPTYMIFDDHEVTDDWNMTRKFCKDVYSSPIGLRIVQNGLAAYALCQHWGNAPEQFDGASTPGGKLLKLLGSAHGVAAYDNASEDIRALLGIQDDKVLARRKNFGLFHGADALTYHYTVEGPGHQIIVTDTRTWRDYPRANPADPDTLYEAGDLLPEAQIQAQIAGVKPDTGDRLLLLVFTTNVPPAQPIRTASRRPNLTKRIVKVFTGDPYPDLYESWEMPRNTTDLLFRVISDRLPLVNNVRKGSALLLSGDVHTSFTSRLLLRGDARYRDKQPQPVNAVFVQMVCSSLRKQNDKTEGQHLDGYEYGPPVASLLVPDHKPEGYFGWNVAVGTKTVVGHEVIFPNNSRFDKPLALYAPGTRSIWNMKLGFKTKVKRDWAYRLDYLEAISDDTMPGAPAPLGPTTFGNTPADRIRNAEVNARGQKNFLKFLQSNESKRQVVGVNNIGEITFNPGHALHILRWHDWSTGTDRETRYVCSLDPDDSLANKGKWPW